MRLYRVPILAVLVLATSLLQAAEPQIPYAKPPALLIAKADVPEPKPPAPTPLPAEVKIVPGKPVTAAVGKKCIVTIDTTAKKVTWRIPAELDTVALDGKRLAVWATPGVYTLVAQVPAGDDVLSTEVILTVTGAIPPPPPVDQLVKDLQAAYATETGATDADSILKLADLLGAVVKSAKASGKITTMKQLQDAVHDATNLTIGANALPAVRKAIGAYLTPKLGNTSAPVTEAFWATAATEYATVSAALKKVGGK